MGWRKSFSLLCLSLLISSMGILYPSLIALSRDFKVDRLATDPAHVNISLTFYWDLCFISTCPLSIFMGIIFLVDGQEVCWPEPLCCATVACTASRGRPGTTLPGRGGPWYPDRELQPEPELGPLGLSLWSRILSPLPHPRMMRGPAGGWTRHLRTTASRLGPRFIPPGASKPMLDGAIAQGDPAEASEALTQGSWRSPPAGCPQLGEAAGEGGTKSQLFY